MATTWWREKRWTRPAEIVKCFFSSLSLKDHQTDQFQLQLHRNVKHKPIPTQ